MPRGLADILPLGRSEAYRRRRRATLCTDRLAHWSLTLTNNAEVHYKASEFYAPTTEDALCCEEPAAAIDWPTGGSEPLLSTKGAAILTLENLDSPFTYNGHPFAGLEEIQF